jgi:hypothetical protein
MATQEEIADSQTRHQTFSDRQTAGLANQYVTILEAAERPLINGDDELDGILGIYDVTTQRQAESLSMAEREVFIAELGAFYSIWYSKYITDGIFRPYRSDLTAKALNEASFVTRNNSRLVSLSLNAPTQQAINSTVYQTQYMGNFYREYVRNYQNIVLNNLNDLTSQRIRQGSPVGNIVEEIRGNPSSQFNYSHNIGRLETHIVTSAKHAEVAADTAFFNANPDTIDGWFFFNPLDSKSSDICIYTYSELSDNGTKVWNVGQGPIPPLHWRCRSQQIAAFRQGLLE